MNNLPFIQLESQHSDEHKLVNACIIWLHGLGANGNDFVPVVPRMKLHPSIKARFVFPDAKMRAISHYGGQPVPAWYDFVIEGMERQVSTVDLMESKADIEALIHQQVLSGIPTDRIIVAGFSQGGALAYEVALNGSFQLGGLMAMSTYLPRKNAIHLNANNIDLPIHVFHGDRDNVVPLALGLESAEELEQKGFDIKVKRYAMEHTVCLEQLDHISAFLNEVLADQ